MGDGPRQRDATEDGDWWPTRDTAAVAGSDEKGGGALPSRSVPGGAATWVRTGTRTHLESRREAPSKGRPGRRVLESSVCGAEPTPGCAPAGRFRATAAAARTSRTRRPGQRHRHLGDGGWERAPPPPAPAPWAPPEPGPTSSPAHAGREERWSLGLGGRCGGRCAGRWARPHRAAAISLVHAAASVLTTHPPTSSHPSP